MKKGFEIGILFWIIVFLIVVAVFVGFALWGKGLGIGFLNLLPGFVS